MDLFLPFFEYPKVQEYKNIYSWRVIDPKECIRTGDLLLFSGSGLLSSGIKLFQASRWNHVGMAVWCELEHYDGEKNVDLYVFEAGSQPFTDLMTRKYVNCGVRLVRFSDIATMYDLVYHRGLNVDHDESWPHRFYEFMMQMKGVPYMRSFITLGTSYLFSPSEVKNEVTCSMLTALMIDYMGVHKLNFNPTQIAPSDYVHTAKAYPCSIYTGKERLIYSDDQWVNARLVFAVVIVVTIIIIIIAIMLDVAVRFEQCSGKSIPQTPLTKFIVADSASSTSVTASDIFGTS